MISNQFKWLEETEDYFLANDKFDIYYIVATMLKEKKMTMLQFLYDAASGHGCVVHEGLEYVLDQDLDGTDEFTEVTFFLGEFVSSEMLPKDFIESMSIIMKAYLKYHPEDEEAVHRNMNKLTERFSAYIIEE